MYLTYLDISWHILTYLDISWHILTYNFQSKWRWLSSFKTTNQGPKFHRSSGSDLFRDGMGLLLEWVVIHGMIFSEHGMIWNAKFGRFHSHGGTPKAGLFQGKCMKIPSRNGWWLGVPLFEETSIYCDVTSPKIGLLTSPRRHAKRFGYSWEKIVMESWEHRELSFWNWNCFLLDLNFVDSWFRFRTDLHNRFDSSWTRSDFRGKFVWIARIFTLKLNLHKLVWSWTEYWFVCISI